MITRCGDQKKEKVKEREGERERVSNKELYRRKRDIPEDRFLDKDRHKYERYKNKNIIAILY